jgi:hypothetical protein
MAAKKPNVPNAKASSWLRSSLYLPWPPKAHRAPFPPPGVLAGRAAIPAAPAPVPARIRLAAAFSQNWSAHANLFIVNDID